MNYNYPVIQSDELMNLNVVSTCSLNCNLNLKDISELTKNSEYNPKKFRAIIIRLRSPKATANVFASGKMVVLGTKNEHDSSIAAQKVARMIQKIKPEVEFKDFTIQNIVASCRSDIPFSFQDFLSRNRYSPLGNLSYDPEIFPGITYKFRGSKIAILIFASGKMVITGAKSRAEINQTFVKIYTLLI